MSATWTVIATAFVLFVLALIAYGLFELSRLGSHLDQLRDPRTGRRRWESPHLETRDEFEQTHDGESPHLETRDEFEHTHGGLA